MAYATQQDIFERMPEYVVLDTVNDERSDLVLPASYERIDEAIGDADSLIDSYLGQRYTVPITPTPRLLTRISCDIAVYYLASRRGFTSQGADEVILQAYQNAISWLKAVANGTASIPGVGGGTISSTIKPKIASQPRYFSRETMKDW